MNRDEAVILWQRAVQALKSSKSLLDNKDPDGAASRAYYAAFYALTAFFGLEGKTFSRHSALETAVHRDLIKTKRWEENLGEGYTYLRESRETGDYGGATHVATEEAGAAIDIAERILERVRSQHSGLFTDWKSL